MSENDRTYKQLMFGDLSKGGDPAETATHIHLVKDLMGTLSDFHSSREETYRMSFARRGYIGVWMNLARKYDRMDGLATEVFSSKTVKMSLLVTLVDTLVDLALYSLKWLALIAKNNPTIIRTWIDENSADLRAIEGDELLMEYLANHDE